MPATEQVLPIESTLTPESTADAAAAIAECAGSKTAVYSIGGGTSLEYGLPAKRSGIGLSVARLDRIVDYPARDMTITVEAGVTLRRIAETLGAEGQQLPVDAPHGERATIGGLVATNWNGPRRYGCGALRDFVIGIEAIDGRGMTFHGGGRVVKNVAGYDFCKLLTGSLGTLAVITRVTLKVRPIAECSTILACEAADEEHARRLLDSLSRSEATPAAIELLGGPHWSDASVFEKRLSVDRPLWIAVGLEGTQVEVNWMTKTLEAEWREQNVVHTKRATGESAGELIRRFAHFSAETPDGAPGSGVLLMASVLPSGVADVVRAARLAAPDVSLTAHAGNGVVFLRFPELPADGLSSLLFRRLQPVVTHHRGHLRVLAQPPGGESTRQSVWGGDAPFWLMSRVKEQFDPHNILNPGRFVFA